MSRMQRILNSIQGEFWWFFFFCVFTEAKSDCFNIIYFLLSKYNSPQNDGMWLFSRIYPSWMFTIAGIYSWWLKSKHSVPFTGAYASLNRSCNSKSVDVSITKGFNTPHSILSLHRKPLRYTCFCCTFRDNIQPGSI